MKIFRPMTVVWVVAALILVVLVLVAGEAGAIEKRNADLMVRDLTPVYTQHN